MPEAEISDLEAIDRRRRDLRHRMEREYNGDHDLIIDALAHHAAVQESIVRKLQEKEPGS